jgi:hypothetical protein
MSRTMTSLVDFLSEVLTAVVRVETNMRRPIDLRPGLSLFKDSQIKTRINLGPCRAKTTCAAAAARDRRCLATVILGAAMTLPRYIIYYALRSFTNIDFLCNLTQPKRNVIKRVS